MWFFYAFFSYLLIFYIMYQRKKVIEYCEKYTFNYNPAYFDFSNFGGDCTNFISQCLFYAGIEMDFNKNGWFYSSPNFRSPSWTSVEEFWNYGKQNINLKLKKCTLSEVEIGDIIQFYNPNQNKYYHTIIITKIIQPICLKNIFVSSHDNNALNKSLLEYNIPEHLMRFGKILN